MTDETTAPDDLRDETAENAPEVAEHDRLGALSAEVEELRQQLLYTQAETQNVRRRAEKEAADAKAYAATGFARDILSVADNLARALASLPTDEALKPLVTGLEMTAKELDNVFQRNGITRIEAMGAKLDPNRHQAMVELASDEPPGTIIQELQAGYMIKDRLLRPAMVAVAKAG